MRAKLNVVLGFPEAVTSTEMRIIDRNSAAWGVASLQLMEAAGKSVAEEVRRRLGGDVKGKKVVVFAGAGGNAGDGLTAARYLASWGARVTVYLLSRPEELRDETLQEYKAVEAMDLSVDVRVIRDPAEIPSRVEADVVVDALLGIGVRGRVRTIYARAIEAINSSKALRVAVDLPSGLDPDTGRPLGPVVKAHVTVTFHKPKKGLLSDEAKSYVGDLVVANIGVPPEAEIYVGPGDVEALIKPRPWTAHKGSSGRVLVVGGSETFTGAPALAALTALRMGVDLVIVAAPERAANIIASYSHSLNTVEKLL
jgi:NAD(P)H-hydrate epimerase